MGVTNNQQDRVGDKIEYFCLIYFKEFETKDGEKRTHHLPVGSFWKELYKKHTTIILDNLVKDFLILKIGDTYCITLDNTNYHYILECEWCLSLFDVTEKIE